MKIKDFVGFNPEAEIKVISVSGIPFDGNLTYGWSNEEGDSFDNSKETATEVCIFLGDIKENNTTA
jgi:hypothetical protein